MKIQELQDYIQTIVVNNMNVGQNSSAIEKIIKLGIIKIYTNILLKIEDITVTKSSPVVVLPERYTGRIIDIIDNYDGREYYIGREDASLIPIHQMGFNKFIVDFDNASKQLDNITNPLEITFFYSVYPVIDSLNTVIPDILVNAISLFVRWQVSVMQPKTSIQTIREYKMLFDEEIINLKNDGIEIDYVPRSYRMLKDARSFSFSDENTFHDINTIYK